MSKWIGKFLRNEPHKRTDNTDKPHNGGHLSVLSVPPQGYFGHNLEKTPLLTTDRTDKPHNEGHLSVLSVLPQGYFGHNLEKTPLLTTDRTDKPHHEGHLSVLSVPPQGVLDLDFGNVLERRPDITDRFKLEAQTSGLSGPDDDLSGNPDLLYEYEERIAIAEYDGHHNPTQSKRIAYQDAFIAVLNTLPYDEMEGDWLKHRIKAVQEWLFFQGLEPPE